MHLLVGDEHRLGGEHLTWQDSFRIGRCDLGGIGLGAKGSQGVRLGGAGEVGEAGVLRAGQRLGEALGGASRAAATRAVDVLLVLGLGLGLGGSLGARGWGGLAAGSDCVGHGAAAGWPIGRRRSMRASSMSTRERRDATSPRDSPRASSACP